VGPGRLGIQSMYMHYGDSANAAGAAGTSATIGAIGAAARILGG
jgi:hypothetical protein